ncbi:dihydroorotate dehydrogenase [Xaviernesmea oryzae]|uniref:Dihydroorotate dehydrogenase n=1 Tax=Xaviernesmea oryzae TaxID=464029 RepID=A0A1Q9ASA5_9HYPH|nr:DUF952 domain-containing protein [Xaviernesmea oryzae]OLP58268.1 dihydroorotate dehydrogenase [Xaviernesmea oryzae]SEL44187.1 Uncharacterized conserved protein, DUF952 family [Xaviernesmea oryzae]
MTQVIYKIVPRALWQEARASGRFEGAPVDLADGFIHFSTADQAVETAMRHFSGQRDLLLVAVDAEALGTALVFEPSRGGALFPHLYGLLPLSAVLWEAELPLGEDGRHIFPPQVMSDRDTAGPEAAR